MQKITGLGRGLSSLIPNKPEKILPKDSRVIREDAVLHVPPSDVQANPRQPRSHFDHDALEELVGSIKEHGILQPLIVTREGDGYQVIAGERRLRAAQILELETVPVIVREAKEQEKLELGLIENIQRRDLNAIEEAVAYQRLIEEFNLTQEEVSRRVGKSRSAVANTLRLLTLPTEIQQAVVGGKINYSTARVIAGLPVEQRLDFFQKVLKQDLTVRAAEGQAKKVSVRKHTRRLEKEPFITQKEEDLQAALGTKVSIKKTGSAGQIQIEFYSEEEFETLIAKLLSS